MRIVDVATSVEEARQVPLEELREACGWTDRDQRIYSRLYGLRSACRHEGLALQDCLSISLAKLMIDHPALFGRIDAMIYCHALNDTMPFDSQALDYLAKRFLGGCADVFSITQSACASAISALECLAAITRENPSKRYFVILTGEKCFDAVLQYASQSGLFGEASTAVLVEAHGAQSESAQFVASAHGRIDGVYDPVVKLDLATRNLYDDEYIPTIVSVVGLALDKAGIEAKRLDALLPTHLSPFTFDRVAKQLGIPDVRIVKDNLFTLGHCFCGDAFINLKSWAAAEGNASTERYAMTFAAGMTGTFAAMILKKEALQ